MAFVHITKPTVGKPTRKQAHADAIIDDLEFLYALVLSSIGSREIITNGSFETEDADLPGYPSGWTVTLYTGGAFLHDESVAVADDLAVHGTRSVKFTRDGTVGHGGGVLTQTDFAQCTENRMLLFSWQQKSSAAGISVAAGVQFYGSDQVLISTSVLYSSTTNPTVWTEEFGSVAPPNNARYFKFKLIGGDPAATVAGSVWFDDVRMTSIPMGLDRKIEFDTAGSYVFRAPANVNELFQIVVGAGGGGGGGGGSGAGGGAGGLAYGIAVVTPGDPYVVVVGAGGALGTLGNPGSSGGNSTFNGYTGNAGAGGASAGGAGGAGGTGTGGQVNVTGDAGEVRTSLTEGGHGGSNPKFGVCGAGATSANGGSGFGYGGGGGGAGDAATGGVGGAGRVIIIF